MNEIPCCKVDRGSVFRRPSYHRQSQLSLLIDGQFQEEMVWWRPLRLRRRRQLRQSAVGRGGVRVHPYEAIEMG